MNIKENLFSVIWVVLAIPLGIILAGAILFVFLVMWMTDVPNKLGKIISIDAYVEQAIYQFVNEDEMESIRDEYMGVIHSKAEYQPDHERWGLLREIDLAREVAIDDLHSGEILIALIGGILTVVVGNVLGVGWAALAVTVVTIFYSFVVAFRILVVDSLAYSSLNHHHCSLREISKMKAWNEGPLRGRGGVGVVMISLVTAASDSGFLIGLDLSDIYSEQYFDYDDDKWRDTTNGDNDD